MIALQFLFCAMLFSNVVVGAEPGLSSPRIYVGAGQQVLLDVTARRDFGKMTLALMTYDGTLIAPPIEVRPGRVDLSEALPAIWSIDSAAYLQMLDGEEPIGSALVLQPMLSRMVPEVAQAQRPDGAFYTRIVGWKDENAPPPTVAPSSSQPPAPATNENGSSEAADEPASQAEANPTANDESRPTRLFSGLRIQLERDVIVRTSAGAIHVRMRHDAAPNTVNNFLHLCEGGFYENVTFHRVVPLDRNGQPFVIQAGDPTGTGDGGPGYWLPIEQSTLPHDLGVISMARADDPDSAGSQFFFCLSRSGTARLDGQYCAFGETIEGSDAILAIATTPLADPSTGRPVEPPVILETELVPAPPRTVGKGRPDHPISSAPPIEAPKPKRVPR